MPKPQLILAAVATLSFSAAHAQPQPYPFALPWNDASKNAIDNSDLNPAPILEKHRLSVKNGHFADSTGRRVRLVGGNLTSTAPFSDRAQIAQVAARMHKLGFNAMRLHHIDAAWADPNLFGRDRKDYNGSNARVDLETLKQMEGTIAEFKKHGIYTNLNLHVSRHPSPADGFPDTDKIPGLGKVVAYFEPRFIQMQKDYAREILDHVNPYTGMRNADDPSIAFIEFNNEDSLTGEAWTGVLQNLPPYYRGILQIGWNKWLKSRYADTNALKAAWSTRGATGANLLRNADFSQGANDWYLEQQGDAKGELATEEVEGRRALRVRVQALPDQSWKLQMSQTGLNLQNGKTYTLSGFARADAPRSLSVYAALDEAPWTHIGNTTGFNLTTQWQPFRVLFNIRDAKPNHSRITFTLGDAKTDVQLADLKLQEGAVADVPASQTLEASTMDLPSVGGVTPRQGADWISYLSDVEMDYVAQMRDFLKKEVKTRALLTCSQASYGGWTGVRREAATDFIDMHAYWEHPSFPGTPWDGKNWLIGNTPMTDDPGGGTFTGLAAYRVAGMPFTVSEYNHAAPNDYASETVPLIFSLAAAQDWDGIYLFEYSGERNNFDPKRIRGFFAVDTDPNKIAPLPAMARAFLTGAIPPLPAKSVLNVPRDSLLELAAGNQGASNWGMQGDIYNSWRRAGLSRRDLFTTRMELRLTNGKGEPKFARSGASGALPVSWEFNGRAGVLQTDAPSAKGLVGRWAATENDAWNAGPRALGELSISDAQSVNGWGVLNAVARDGKPLSQSRSVLVSVLNRAENLKMGWNPQRTTVSDQWGSGPPQVMPLSATLTLKTRAKSARVFALDASGKRRSPIKSQLSNGVLSFRVGDAKTPWYEVALEQPSAAKLASKAKVKVASQ